jgi:predicted DsbA family dithiol-disulfide isomerase
MKAFMAQFSRSFGIEDMKHPGHMPNTRRALAIAELARDEGKLTEFRRAAMDAHWRYDKDLESEKDLRAIAESVGLDGAAAVRVMDDPVYQKRVDAMREEASSKGVTGIPTFFVNGVRVVGCQPYEVLADIAKRAG